MRTLMSPKHARMHSLINIKGSAQIFDAKHKLNSGKPYGLKFWYKVTKNYTPPYQ